MGWVGGAVLLLGDGWDMPSLGITRPASYSPVYLLFPQISPVNAHPIQVLLGGFDVVHSLFKLEQHPAQSQKYGPHDFLSTVHIFPRHSLYL